MTSHCVWNPEQNTVYIKFAKNNVREIDWNYLILTINKWLFTMKVENHDTTKLGSQYENILKREIQRMWTNIKLYLTTYTCNQVVLVFSHSTVIVRILCVFTNYKIIENIDFCSWRTYEKIYKNVFNFILYSHSQLVTGARDPDMIATLSLSYFNVMTWSL